MHPKTDITHLTVGIMQTLLTDFCLHGDFLCNGKYLNGWQKVSWSNGFLVWNGMTHKRLSFTPLHETSTFTLSGVTIGKAFHWQRHEDQTFRGSLLLQATKDGILAINRIALEDYLESVVGSEMKSTAPREFLKAAAIVSRSWLLHQIMYPHRHTEHTLPPTGKDKNEVETHITWTEREAHDLFDVCADDHCQRYQGISKIQQGNAIQAVKDTRGQILMASDGKTICDARFSKCCGGISEEYETCWADQHIEYLSARRDTLPSPPLPDLGQEDTARKWILSSPAAFCNTQDKIILQTILNDFDLETADFYRWRITYTPQQLRELLLRKTGIDYGPITDLIPLQRGPSARIVRLLIKGPLRQRIIGKELAIRSALSESHLYSSAFIVDKEEQDSKPIRFTLTGAGWGHGVGLCQIGAAVMAQQGYSYTDILSHYYKDTTIKTIY